MVQLGQMVDLFLFPCKTSILTLKGLLAYTPMSRDQGSSFPTSSPWFTAITFDDSSSDVGDMEVKVHFICVSLRVRDAEHFCKYLLAICVACEKCCFVTHFFIFRSITLLQSLIKFWILALV